MSSAALLRLPIVAGNWKMNYGPTEARAFVESILEDLTSIRSVERVLCPPAISIPAVHTIITGTDVALGAQNMYYEERGAYTGEISPLMLKGLCRYVILGHSERRIYFGETDELINKKALSALAHDLRPIVCVGERLEQRDANLTDKVIIEQVHGSLANLPTAQLAELVVAYEPIWAIGTGRAASPQDATIVAALIRSLLADMYGFEAAHTVRILYGGSVTPTNAASFAAIPDIGGSLVGGASIKADFVEIVRQTALAKGLPA